MAVSPEMLTLLEYTQRLVRDADGTIFAREDIEQALRNHATIVNGIMLKPDPSYRIYTPFTIRFDTLGFMASSATLNTQRDRSGTDVIADTSNYLNVQFRFDVKQDYIYLWLFGDAFNPFFAAADLLDPDPTNANAGALKSLTVGDYRADYATDGTACNVYRRRGMWLNRERAANMTEGLYNASYPFGTP